MSIGPAEIIIVLVIALLVFGPSRLPQMGKSLGRGVREFKKAADTAKTELGLGEVTDGINEIKSTFTAPVSEVTSTFTDLKNSVDVKSAIEAPVGGAAVAGTAGAAALGVVDPGPETPDVTPATVFADITPPPEPEGPGAEAKPEAPEAPRESASTPVEAAQEPVAESASAAAES